MRQGLTLSLLVLGLAACQSAAFGQDDSTEMLDRIWASVDAGQFSETQKLIDAKIGKADEPVTGPLAEAREIMRRIRYDFSLSREAMLAKLRGRIHDASEADLDRWTQEGLLQHRVIDGEVWYFRREPSNLMRFCGPAKDRWAASKEGKIREPDTWSFNLVGHLEGLVKLSEQSEEQYIYPVRHRVRYRLSVKPNHPRSRSGAKVRCWLPYPQEYGQQDEVRLVTSTPANARVAANGHPHRTIYFEKVIDHDGEPLSFSAEFEFVTRAVFPKLDPDKVSKYDTSSELYRKHTAARPPHVTLDDQVKALAAEIVGEEPNPLLRAKRIFEWVCHNIRYCSEMEYSTIRSLTAKALATRKGDCGVQAMTFITLCRAAGVPARWQSGWETIPEDWNMHDWAEFYVEPWGWLPADPSYGLQEHDDPRVREFYFGRLDAYRMIVNLDYGRELDPAKTSFRSEPNDFQRGEIEIDGHNLYFDEWDWQFEVETLPPAMLRENVDGGADEDE